MSARVIRWSAHASVIGLTVRDAEDVTLDGAWRELVEPADRAIPQPYEVHGASGKAYVADVLDQWKALGAREIILGRGAHELDDSDADYWRTPAEIRAHRSSTPPGMPEAWWLAGGTPPARVVDAIVAPTS